MAPPVVEVRSPRAEKLLTDTTLRLQQKVDELEARLVQKNQELRQEKNKAEAQGHGSTGDHLELAAGHFGQAVASMCSCLRLAPAAPSPPASPMRRSMRTPPMSPSAKSRSSLHGRKGILPDWASKTEQHLSKGLYSASMDTPKSLSQTALEEHEYVLEDEWGFAQTNGVINPKSQWKETWDIGIMLLILYSATVVPFRICFSAEAEGYVWDFEVFTSIVFLIDVCFTFNTSFFIDDKMVVSRRRITMRYLSGASRVLSPTAAQRVPAHAYTRKATRPMRDLRLSPVVHRMVLD